MAVSRMELRGALIIMFLIYGVRSDTLQFTKTMNNHELSESTEVGGVVYTLEASSDSDTAVLTYRVQSPYFSVDGSTGDVRLIATLNYETTKTIDVTVSVSSSEGDTIERQVTVLVTDANDNWPEFGQNLYSVTVYEDAAIGFTVIPNITVKDADTNAGDILQVRCEKTDQSVADVCGLFIVVSEERTRSYWQGHLVVGQPLDYEDGYLTKTLQGTYEIELSAHDGRESNDRRGLAKVVVLDVNDSPPKFTGTLTATIEDGTTENTLVLTVTAKDSDTMLPREIQYSITSNPGDYFKIDPTSGEITTKQVITREGAEEITDITIIVRASELIEGVVSDDDRTYTERHVTFRIEDRNNNAPTFSQTSYNEKLSEEARVNEIVPGLDIVVIDRDQGDNAKFELELEGHEDIFRVSPTVGQGSVTANIYVRDDSTLDYDELPRQYTLKLIAREVGTTQLFSSEVSITIELTDVNDNEPEFGASEYFAEISETATSGTTVITITATDKDWRPADAKEELRYRLSGNNADYFSIDQWTGVITVDHCSPPGSGNCLDFERQTEYRVTVQVGDRGGEGYLISVPLTVTLLDENDNGPQFELTEYVSYIREKEINPVPKLKVEATDADSARNNNNQTVYSIIEGNDAGIWQIGRENGIIIATRPVTYTPQYVLTVEASDSKFSARTQVKIIVIDINDHSPVFKDKDYEQSIHEDTAPGYVVETVSATDEDPSNTPNGQIEYRIVSGSQDKFTIDGSSGTVTVAEGATFDRETRPVYNIEILAEDKGQPRKSDTAFLVVNILDSNNKNPYFQPSTVREDIFENADVNSPVVKMNASDPDTGAVLRYSIGSPIEALDSNGAPISDTTLYEGLFDIDAETGVVYVSGVLDSSVVSRVTIPVVVRDISAPVDQPQSATGTLIVNIIKVNADPPRFRAPWTPDNPYINIIVVEEQPVDSLVYTLLATDPTDDKVTYTILNSDPEEYFKIDQETGVITVARQVDFEVVEKIEVVVVATDDGKPTPLQNTATIVITVDNINDENPEFKEDEYIVDLMENSPGGTEVVKMEATDDDKGDYGVVNYKLNDNEERFDIDTTSGQITVRDGAVLDRETTPVIIVTVTAFDSLNDPEVSRFNSIQVTINLLDENDNSPEFTKDVYSRVMVNSESAGTPVVVVSASDADAPPNNNKTFSIIGGDPNGFFFLDPTTGQISTAKPLDNNTTRYTLTVQVTDGVHTDVSYVEVTVLLNTNRPPIWKLPEYNNFTEIEQEEQYVGLEVIKVLAEDPDDHQVFYYFRLGNRTVQDTPEFRINRITGEITARIIFDRETQDVYTLQLVARDDGSPEAESLRFLTVKISDIDDNPPSFPVDDKCCVKEVYLDVAESRDVGTILGQVIATDNDIGDNAVITYHKKDGDPREDFSVDLTSGELRVAKRLDKNVQSKYRIDVVARNPGQSAYNYKADASCAASCSRGPPSTIRLHITVTGGDVTFPHPYVNACVPFDAEIGRYVTDVKANNHGPSVTYTLDVDGFQIYEPKLKLLDTVSGLFSLDSSTASVTTADYLENYRDKYIEFDVKVSEPHSTTVRVWVTEESYEVKITLKNTPDKVSQDIEEIKRLIAEETTWRVVCVKDIRYHITAENIVDVTSTDILLYVIDEETLMLLPPGEVTDLLVPYINAESIVGVAAVHDAWGGFYRTPVIVAIILIILLLLLALLLLCCCWFCCAVVAHDEAPPPYLLSGMINPLWKSNTYEDQELNMSVLSLETAHLAGVYNNGFVGDSMVHTETKREYSNEFYDMSNGAAYGHDMVDSSRAIHAGLSASTGALDTSTPVADVSTMTDTGGVAVETTRFGAFEAHTISTSSKVYNGPYRIGATLNKSEGNLAGLGADRAYSRASSGPTGFHMGEVSATNFDTLPPFHGGSTSQQYQTDSSSFSQTRQTHRILSDSTLDDDVLITGDYIDAPGDNVYQGEINLGGLPIPSPPPYASMRQDEEITVPRVELVTHIN